MLTSNIFNVILRFFSENSFKINEDFLLVSFAPIWKLAKFLDYFKNKNPEKLTFLKGIIACSSSSLHTKRFSFSKFDKKLYEKLNNSELIITKIYHFGSLSIFSDKKKLNISTEDGSIDEIEGIHIIDASLLKNLPLLLIPSESGLRQPIHSYQLALVAFYKTKEFIKSSKKVITTITLGGDITLSYKQILDSLNNENKIFKNKRKCLILEIPNRIYYFLLSPLLLFKPKWFAALLRLNSNLSGFRTVSEFTKKPKRKFPLLRSDFNF